MPKLPKDDDHLSIRLLMLEASAKGRYPISCLFVIVLLVLAGKASGYL